MKIDFLVTFCIIVGLTNRSTEAQPSSTDIHFIVFLFFFQILFPELEYGYDDLDCSVSFAVSFGAEKLRR